MKKELPMRKNIRLQGYDYSKEGCYYITICVKDRHEMFGSIINGQIKLTEYGIIAENNSKNIPVHVKGVLVDKYVIMPNHVHLLMTVTENVGTRYIASNEPVPDDKRTPYMVSLQSKSKLTY